MKSVTGFKKAAMPNICYNAKAFPRIVSSKYMGTYKSSTGLVGLAVDPDGKKTMQDICTNVLRNIQVSYRPFLPKKSKNVYNFILMF